MSSTIRKLTASLAVAGAVVGISSGALAGDNSGKSFHVTLTGAEGGNPEASGIAMVSTSDRTENVCYEISNVQGIGKAVAAHIHRGAKGESGPPVVTIEPPTDGSSKGCVTAEASVVDAIEANPSGYYINIHTPEHPGGALRGQLGS